MCPMKIIVKLMKVRKLTYKQAQMVYREYLKQNKLDKLLKELEL